jgi:hypothetical protein
MHGAQRADFVSFAKRDLAATRARATVERQDQGTVKFRGVKGAGGVAQVMLELLELDGAAQMLAKLANRR